MGKILVIKGADFSANKIEKVSISTDPNKLVLWDFTRKFFNNSDFTTEVPLNQANRIRYYVYVEKDYSIYVEYDGTELNNIGVNVQPTEQDCYRASTGTAVQLIANPVNGSVSATITVDGWLCISVAGPAEGLLTQEMVDYIENNLTVEVTIQ